jgi:hypothetical protein
MTEGEGAVPILFKMTERGWYLGKGGPCRMRP